MLFRSHCTTPFVFAVTDLKMFVTLGAAAIRKNAAIDNVKIESVRFILGRDLKPRLVDCIRNYSARFAGNHLVKF